MASGGGHEAGILRALLGDAALPPPDTLVATFIAADGAETAVTAGAFQRRAGGFRLALETLGVRPGDVVAIVHPSGPDLHAAWLGALLAGGVPTMVAPPSPRMEPRKYAEGFASIMRELGIAAAVTDAATRDVLGAAMEGVPLVIGERVADAAPRAAVPRAAGAPLLLQHTSGTTGLQKAVAFTRAQIERHAEAYADVLALDARDRVVSWLPLYHDMGFIACFVTPLWLGLPIVEMSPFTWVERPTRLFDAIERHRGTLCWLPNFAFAVLGRDAERAADRTWDLSSMRAFINCSEPVQAASIDRFTAALARSGVAPERTIASYAMAENLFMVTQNPLGRPVRRRFDRAALSDEGLATPSADGVWLVSSGRPISTTRVEVRGGDGAALGDGRVGEIVIAGTHLFDGYRHEEQPTVVDGWYATGDLGFLRDGELYITGRRKELIIVRGRNIYPQDVEQAVGEIDGVNPGRIAVFGIADARSGTEKLVILLELLSGRDAEGPAIALAVRQAVVRVVDVVVGEVRIAPPRALIKSTSGKVARALNRQRYLDEKGDGAFSPTAPSG